MRVISYSEAICEALCEEMRRDENVYMLGEDIGVYGGAFGVSAGMLEEFGERRILDTPISESAIIGAGIGSAMTGMRPVAELMFSDFMAVCYDQIMNQAAKLSYMFAEQIKIPMVIRTASGGGTGAAAQHSQSLENLYCHIPGLKVVVPSTPYDAKGLLKSAVRDDSCVIFLEGKLLYPTLGEVPEAEYLIPFGQADIKRVGRDVSIITYGRTVGMCLEVAEKLAAENISAEVLDLRTLVPLDRRAILDTAAKTGRVVVVHEATEFGGFGGEIISVIAESAVYKTLRAPLRRVGALYSPIPFSPELEKAVLPSTERIERVLREVLQNA